MAINQKLLVVEDNTFMRALISDLLVSLGFEVEAVESASAAVKAAARFDPDAAILDVELGAGPNGFDLARILRESAPEIGLVFLTNIPEPKTIGVDNRSIPKDAAYLVKDSVGDIDLLQRADGRPQRAQGDL